MADTQNKLDLTAKDIELIEAALHTQKKILAVQSEAGGTGARQRLQDLNRLSRRVSRVKPACTAWARFSWAPALRGLFVST